MAKQTYEIVSTAKVDGEIRKPGQRLELDEKSAQPLIDSRAIKPAADAGKSDTGKKAKA